MYPIAAQPGHTSYPATHANGYSAPAAGRQQPLSLSIPSAQATSSTVYDGSTAAPGLAYPKPGYNGYGYGYAQQAQQQRQPTPTARSPAPSSPTPSTWHYQPHAQYHPSLSARTPPPAGMTYRRPNTVSPPPMPNQLSYSPVSMPQPVYGPPVSPGGVRSIRGGSLRSSHGQGHSQGSNAAVNAVSRRIAETAEGKLAVGIDFG